MLRIVWIMLILIAGGSWARAVEPWTDGRLKVTDGLEVWLDAAAIDRARTDQWYSLTKDGQRLAVWHDGSGHGRHAVQGLQATQPIFHRLGEAATVRFDGEDDHLSLAGLTGEHRELTIFLLASPRANPGGSRAILSASQPGRNDFTHGLNIDLGAEASESLDALNVEGAGFEGAQDMLQETGEFGQYQVIAVTVRRDKGVIVHLHGRANGYRERQIKDLRLDTVTLGARYYSHIDEVPYLQGFFEGNIAEVLIYGRALSNLQRTEVENYLIAKREALHRAMAEYESGYLLTPVKNAPPVQMLVPGFTVRQLPLDLTNINNLRYRADGKLVALGYNGNIWLLSDTDGDGLEDHAELFWDNPTGPDRLQSPLGMALTPPGYPHGQGLFVAGKGKVSLVVDTDGDDRADKQIIVAEGWGGSLHQVDALGVAIDKAGYIYFGLGTPWFADPYLIDKQTGQAKFDITGERGTILKVWPDFSKREIICTGIRFPVALAFNREGDLFATDQEGATWMPNGNPFDELLHIQAGRHYGFPPKHPVHLPEVPGGIDEPSTYDYGPQHQSTCGLVFNESINGGPVFGPSWWAGDAIVMGESRGKIYRTKLVKTRAGYIAQNQVIACLDMLTIDACVSPDGSLLVACHSGAPDWGTGPDGKGKLYKISYSHPRQPQPVRAWAAGPNEVRIAFDRPLDSDQLAGLSQAVKIEYGLYVRAGDRFETIWPGYAVVERQRATPRFNLPVHSVSISPDRRTLILTTDSHRRAVHYAVTLPTADGAIDVDYDLTGVEASWADPHGSVQWTGWLPHPDLNVSRALTSGSSDHEQLWALCDQPGKLTLAARIDMHDVFRPAVQIGSRLDYEPQPEDDVELIYEGAAAQYIDRADDTASGRKASLLRAVLQTSGRPANLNIAFRRRDDPIHRPVPLHRIAPPWAPRQAAEPQEPAERHIPQIAGGNWLAGRQHFFGDQAMCSRCHAVGGEGGRIGPDLSNLVHRDYASVLRDIEQPSAALNPEHIAYSIALSDGRTIIGVPRTGDDGRVVIGDAAGSETTVTRQEIRSMEPLAVSIMPASLNHVLGEEKFRDLMTFLLTEPMVPAKIEAPHPPAPRSRREVEEILAVSRSDAVAAAPLNILLVAGPKDHGPGEHDYPLWQQRWAKLLGMAENVTVDTADEWPTAAQFDAADVIVLYQKGDWTADRARDTDAFLSRGKGMVYLHWAVNGREGHEDFARRLGLAAQGGKIKFRNGPLDLAFTEHQITRGFTIAHFVDESYWQLTGDPSQIEVLATAVEAGEPRPLLWTRHVGDGRIFVSILGHYTWTFDDPLFRILVLRGIAWAAGQPADRLTDLATVGARLAD